GGAEDDREASAACPAGALRGPGARRRARTGQSPRQGVPAHRAPARRGEARARSGPVTGEGSPRRIGLHRGSLRARYGGASLRRVPDGRVEGEHPSGVVVRPYAPDDRPAVRTLCHRVGYMGESAAWYWRHAESFADIWTSYYTDREPESFFVAVRDGTLIGYLAGCVDSRNAPTPTAAV